MAQKRVCMIMLRHSALDDRIFYKEARTLRDAGYDVHLICRLNEGAFTDMGGNPVGYPDQNGRWEYDGMTFHGIPKRRGSIGKWKEYHDIVKIGLSLKADVYHCHESDIALSAAVRIKQLLGHSTKFIYDMHEFGSASWKDIMQTGWKNILLSIFTCSRKKALKYSDAVITANSIVRGYSLSLNRLSKVEVIENAPVLSIFKESAESKKTGNSIILCHEGNMSFDRGLKEMVSLVKNSSNKVILKIIGTIGEKEKKWLEAQIKDSPNLSYLIYLSGWLPYEEVGNAISQCNVGLIVFRPTTNNMLAGPPNKLYNYMRFGLPVVSVDLPETRAIISKYQCGIIVKGWNVDSFTQAIQYLIDHPDEARAMGERGKKAILNELTWEHQAKKLLRIYEEMFTTRPFIVYETQ